MAQIYKHKRTSIFLINYHIVWCPKRRRKILTGSLKERLKVLIHDVVSELGCEILALEIMPDHLHLFVSALPMLSAHILVRRIKGRSSRILRQEFPFLLKMPSLWTRSYFVSTAGNVSNRTIQRYIAEQKTRG